MIITLEVIKTLQAESAGMSAECLRRHIADNAMVLPDLIGLAENMSAARDASFEDEELYQEAVAEVMSAVLLIAVFTAELVKHPAPVATFTASAN